MNLSARWENPAPMRESIQWAGGSGKTKWEMIQGSFKEESRAPLDSCVRWQFGSWTSALLLLPPRQDLGLQASKWDSEPQSLLLFYTTNIPGSPACPEDLLWNWAATMTWVKPPSKFPLHMPICISCQFWILENPTTTNSTSVTELYKWSISVATWWENNNQVPTPTTQLRDYHKWQGSSYGSTNITIVKSQ